MLSMDASMVCTKCCALFHRMFASYEKEKKIMLKKLLLGIVSVCVVCACSSISKRILL